MNLKDALEKNLPPDELSSLVSSYDIVGDIAITIIPTTLEKHQSLIGETILQLNKNVRVVAKRDGNYSGHNRTIPLHIIAGENRKETVCREFGLKLLVNPELVYFSVRLGNERKRIADLVQPGEQVLTMFSGIAPFALMISKYSEASQIIGIEANLHAHQFGVKNISLNKSGNIRLLHGDVQEILPGLNRKFDRIVMPLPKSARKYLPLALDVLKDNGKLHLYEFMQTDSYPTILNSLKHELLTGGRKLQEATFTKCGHCSPKLFRVCVDMLVS